MSDFLGITREREFSPGRVADDEAILREVAACLAARGHRVQVHDADAAPWPQPRSGVVVFAMCQGPRAIERLFDWEQRGIRIVNRPQAILNCQRRRSIALLRDAAVGLPESVVVDTRGEAALPDWVAAEGAWVKRGDVHATQAGDVVRAEDAARVRDALRRLRTRGIAAAVVQRHIPGVVLKFYAVHNSFFDCVPAASAGGVPTAALRRIARIGSAAAARLGVEIYGGDCVHAEGGELSLIDLNDWPSYRTCRAPAAAAIADYILAQKDLPT